MDGLPASSCHGRRFNQKAPHEHRPQLGRSFKGLVKWLREAPLLAKANTSENA